MRLSHRALKQQPGRLSRRASVGSAGLAAFLMLGAAGNGQAQAPAAAASAQTPALQTVRVISFTGVSTIPLRVAAAQGTFAKYGLDVVTEFTPNSTVLREGLAAGKYDVAHAAVDNAVAMAETDHADVVILMGSDDSMTELIVQPTIGSVTDLRGKTVAVDAPNTAYALQLRKILLMNGLTAGTDYTMKVVGGTPQRLQAMIQDKENAAAMLNPPSSIQAKAAGLKSLGSAAKLIGPYQGVGAFVLRPWATAHRDTLVKYLAAYVEALRWFLAPANKAQAIAFLTADLKLSPEVAAEAYARAVATPGGLVPDARLDVAGLANVLKLRAEIENQWKGIPPPPERYCDLSYHDAALARLAGRSR
jgi:ABC-type nitrate/sulfonate/bicarbonate transport system substrate-binding protein